MTLLFENAALTGGGLVAPVSSLECAQMPPVEVDAFLETALRGGHLTVTSHRLHWRAADSRAALALPYTRLRRAVANGYDVELWAVQQTSTSPSASPLPSRPSTVAPMLPNSGAAAAARPSLVTGASSTSLLPPSAALPTPIKMTIRLRHRSDAANVAAATTRALESSAWKVDAAAAGAAAGAAGSAADEGKDREFTTRHAGVAGIIQRKTEQTQQRDEVLRTAFTDMNGLFEKARELVALAQKLRTIDANVDSEDAEFRGMLLEMGISNPVTKRSAGAAYHAELARQLCDAMTRPLQRRGGMIALPDVYCMFNRARGTEMISPDDLYRAAVLMDELQLPVRLRQFASGVRVLQLTSHDDAVVARRIHRLVRTRGPLSAVDVSLLEDRPPLSLAIEQLSIAERALLLCRDESSHGVVWHDNFFVDHNCTAD